MNSMIMKGIGDRITFGHYRVVQRDDGSLWELGVGAMGVTYKALDTDLQCPVALKVINSNRMADEVNRNRFLREARAAAGLRDSNIASVYHLAMDAEQFFYAMEFIDGQTTEAYVTRFGPMSVSAALRIAWQVSKALAAAAKRQLVHRDIKPANIMIVADSEEEDWPCVKLIDFGLVRSVLRGHGSTSATRSGFVGTAQFASPEQIEETEVDARSDIYSLGCTLWYLLTGEAPFTGSLASVFAQHLGSEPPWEKLRPFPKRISRLLRRMLRKEPSQRPASAAELRREIEQCLVDVERREALATRIAHPFNIGRQWLSAAPRSRGALICSAPVIGGLLLAFGYMRDNGFSPGSTAVQSGGVASAQDPANSNDWFAKKAPGWSYLGNGDEPFWSLDLARRISFAETSAPYPAVVGPKRWLPEDSIWDAEVAEPFVGKNDSRSGKENPFSTAVAFDDFFSVGASENRKVSIQDKDEVETTKRPATKRPVKKPQRRVASKDADREFSPLRELQRVRKNIKRVINNIL
jgi:serine/threonine protein kinase